jgi:ABC-2 type transport system ATP-binding protein
MRAFSAAPGAKFPLKAPVGFSTYSRGFPATKKSGPIRGLVFSDRPGGEIGVAALIEIDKLSKRFGPLTAVDGVSFRVERGALLGFLGPNGAGKTTTMRMITGFLEPDAGSIRVSGHDVVEDPVGAKALIGYLPEGAPLYGDMTPAGLLRFVTSARRMPARRAAERIDWVVERLGLGTVLAQSIETLSKGYKRRVGLAQALVHDPEVLILDEPTDGLDPNQKHEVRGLIRDLAPHKAIVISTHLLEEVDAVCSRALIIDRGRIVADGTPLELAARSSYHNAVTITLSGVPAGEVETSLRAIKGVAKVSVGKIDGGALECTVFPKGAHAIAGEVSRQLQSTGWQVDRFGVETGRLEEVFRNVTTGARAARKGPEAKTR